MKKDVVVTLRDNDQGIIENKIFQQKTFDKRLDEYYGEISVCDFDWANRWERSFYEHTSCNGSGCSGYDKNL